MIEFEICPMTTDAEKEEKGYVHWKSWQETYKGLMPDHYLSSLTLEKCIKMAFRFPKNTLLLKVNHQTVGFSCVGNSLDTEGANELFAIYLLKEYYGQKLGYELLKRTVSSLADRRPLVLWVLRGNDRAIRFYEKFGFAFNGNEKACPFGMELQMEMKRE
ncbi:MAG: GNAT family N-acetyltransferase [Clostridia bacterium]|nr:GNAT family N-acetyltransferase [Clostridia bacterium]